MNAEQLAAAHSDLCPPACPACLSRDLQAKADAVRETCAQQVDEMAHEEARDGGKVHLAMADRLRNLSKRLRRGMA